MKKILILSSKAHITLNLVERLNTYGIDNADQFYVEDFNNIRIEILEKTKIFINGTNILDFDLVLFRQWKKSELDIVLSIASYLASQQKNFIDSSLNHQLSKSKLFQYVALASEFITIPKTIFISGVINFEIYKDFTEKLGDVFIMKDIFGHGGEHNYLITSETDFQNTVTNNPSIVFVFQEYIPHDFDYRIITFDFKTEIIKKKVKTNVTDHRTNTAIGGVMHLVEGEEITEELTALAENAAKATKRQFAGIDIIRSKKTGKLFVIEVNTAPLFSPSAKGFSDTQKFYNFLHSHA